MKRYFYLDIKEPFCSENISFFVKVRNKTVFLCRRQYDFILKTALYYQIKIKRYLYVEGRIKNCDPEFQTCTIDKCKGVVLMIVNTTKRLILFIHFQFVSSKHKNRQYPLLEG